MPKSVQRWATNMSNSSNDCPRPAAARSARARSACPWRAAPSMRRCAAAQRGPRRGVLQALAGCPSSVPPPDVAAHHSGRRCSRGSGIQKICKFIGNVRSCKLQICEVMAPRPASRYAAAAIASRETAMPNLPVPVVTIGLLARLERLHDLRLVRPSEVQGSAACHRDPRSAGASRSSNTCCRCPPTASATASFRAAELKTIQEVITLSVFAVFSVLYLKEPLTWNHLVGFALHRRGAFFIFHKWA